MNYECRIIGDEIGIPFMRIVPLIWQNGPGFVLNDSGFGLHDRGHALLNTEY